MRYKQLIIQQSRNMSRIMKVLQNIKNIKIKKFTLHVKTKIRKHEERQMENFV